MKKVVGLMFVFLLVSWSVNASLRNKPIMDLLLLLDHELEKSPEYVDAKLDKIERLRHQDMLSVNLEERFWRNKMFYDEYYVFNADSAMYYVDANIAIARNLGKKEWENEWMINKAFVLSATGLLKEAGELLLNVSPSELTHEQRVSYYEQMIYYYSHLGQYVGLNKEFVEMYNLQGDKLKKELLGILNKNDLLYYWFKASFTQSLPISGEEYTKLLKTLENMVYDSQLDKRLDALHAYALAHMHKNKGNEEGYKRFLILSSIADVRSCNRDIASLQELADILYVENDIDRAYNYIYHCLQSALRYPNRVRVFGISNTLDKIYVSLQEKNRCQQELLQTYLIWVSLLSLVLIVSLVFIYYQMKKVARSRLRLRDANIQLNDHVSELSDAHKQLASMNDELNAVNEQLKSANSLLCESNYVKEEYIGYVFFLCSNYIGKLEEFRKNINRKMKAGQFDEVVSQTGTTSLVHNELKDFYKSFDAVFLHVYPDFVNDFNALLRPEEQICVKDGELLNTELRIYALVRLGINDSVKIAEFLHCSPQTVYNNRLKIRNKAGIPKDEFLDRVRSLGKIQQ